MATRCSAEFRERAVELARLHEKPIKQFASDLDISDATLHGWLKQTNIDEGLRERLPVLQVSRSGTTSGEVARRRCA